MNSIDISAEVRAFEPDSTPILSNRPWATVRSRTFQWMEEYLGRDKRRLGRPVTRGNVTQINTQVFPTGSSYLREAAIRDLKRDIEMTILGDQKLDVGSDARARRTASLRRLRCVDPSTVSIVFLRPFTEQQLVDGRTMIAVEWGLRAVRTPEEFMPGARAEGFAA